MKRSEFIEKAIGCCHHPIVYAKGCLGRQMTASKEKSLAKQYPDWYKTHTFEQNRDSFGMDCICFVKCILWGWTPENEIDYKSNGIDDKTVGGFISSYCYPVSDPKPGDFCVNESKSHVGIYAGVYDGEIYILDCNFYKKTASGWPQAVRVHEIGDSMKHYYRFKNWDPEEYTVELTPVMKRGDKSPAVTVLQHLLNYHGARDASGNTLQEDGSFGRRTEEALYCATGEKTTNFFIWADLLRWEV